jgi:hypothetical protein
MGSSVERPPQAVHEHHPGYVVGVDLGWPHDLFERRKKGDGAVLLHLTYTSTLSSFDAPRRIMSKGDGICA